MLAARVISKIFFSPKRAEAIIRIHSPIIRISWGFLRHFGQETLGKAWTKVKFLKLNEYRNVILFWFPKLWKPGADYTYMKRIPKGDQRYVNRFSLGHRIIGYFTFFLFSNFFFSGYLLIYSFTCFFPLISQPTIFHLFLNS